MSAWHFYHQRPTDPVHNPISGEFFSTEAVGDVAEAVVREGIQNSLDARLSSADGTRERAEIRIFLSGVEGALSSLQTQRWFELLWPHIKIPGNGLRDQPSENESCPFLLFEDFNTSGLTGDTETHEIIEGVTNHFLNFFRAEGHSDKTGKDVGSWGVGKMVFPRASRISSFFGLTIRNDDKKAYLLGRSILRYHRIGSQAYKSDGYFGRKRDDDFMLPITDPDTIREFSDDFRIKRKNESGLSIVVPWYENNDEDGISKDRVLEAVLRGFFYPILMGHLAVSVATPDSEIRLDSDSIFREVELMNGTSAGNMLPIIHLAEWAQTRIATEFKDLSSPSSDAAQTWRSELVTPELSKDIQQDLIEKRRIALRIPMFVHPRSGDVQSSFFNMFLERSEDDNEKPIFIRDELIITDVKSPRVQKIRSLVIVEDNPLATLLRDAETPAHTQWNQETGNFKNKYKFGASAIKFVSKSVSELMRIIRQTEQEADPTITIDYFWIPATAEDVDSIPSDGKESKAKEGGGATKPVQPIPPHAPKRFRIVDLQGGFAIRPGDADAVQPKVIDVVVAYDVRAGNPLRLYNTSDFELENAPIKYIENINGMSVEKIESNHIRLRVEDGSFNFEVTGFDRNRDLYVKANVVEEVDVDQTN